MSGAVTLSIAFFVSEVSAISEVSAVCGAKSFRKGYFIYRDDSNSKTPPTSANNWYYG